MPQSGFLVRPTDFVASLTGPWSLRPATLAVFGATVFLPTTASEYARMATPDLLTSALIALVSVGSTVLLLVVVRLVFSERARRSLPTMLVTLIVIGILRGLTTTAVVAAWHVENQSFLLTRVALGTLSIPLVLAFITLAVERVGTAREQRATTRIAISEAGTERTRVLDEIRTHNDRFFDEIDRTLRPALDDITRRIAELKGTRESIATSIEKLAEDIIRPLSHTLDSLRSTGSVRAGSVRTEFVSPGRPSVRELINPFFSAITVAMGGSTVMVDILPLHIAVSAAIIAGISTWGMLAIVRGLFGSRALGTVRSGIVVALLHAVAWIPAQIVNREFVFPPDFAFDPSYVGYIATPVLGLLYLFIVIGAYSSRGALARLDHSRVDMVLQLSEARRRAWLQQRHITHTLHSSIQSRILAEARLLRSGKGALSTAERKQAIDTLRSILTVSVEESPVPADSLDTIHDLIRFWKGMCAIELTVDDEVPAALSAEPEVAETLNAVVLEIISNAIRHGNATRIDIAICRASVDTIRVTATNNGSPVDVSYVPSLGMSLYDELTAHWDIRNENGVTVEAILAARGNISAPTGM